VESGEAGNKETVLVVPHRKMNARLVACTSNVRNATRQIAARILVSRKINHMYEPLPIDLPRVLLSY
jgi:hypothetical protein